MNGLLLLFYCLEILAALLCGADGIEQNITSQSTTQNSTSASSPPDFPTAANGTSEASSLTSTETFTTVSLLSSSRSPAATSVRPLKTTTSTTSTTSTTVAPNWGIYRRECRTPYLVSAVLIIVCTVLLVSSLMLTCTVRHLSSRLKALSGDTDLISNSEFWMGTARKNKSRSGPEAKETSVLMTDFSQTPEVMGDGANMEEGRKVSVDGQMGEENKKKVEDNGESKKETPVTKKSLSSKPQEETTDPKSSKAEADSTSEEPKGEV